MLNAELKRTRRAYLDLFEVHRFPYQLVILWELLTRGQLHKDLAELPARADREEEERERERKREKEDGEVLEAGDGLLTEAPTEQKKNK